MSEISGHQTRRRRRTQEPPHTQPPQPQPEFPQSNFQFMETIGDDLLSIIAKKLENPNDKKSFSLVSKQWFEVERFARESLRLIDPSFVHDILPRYPNLTFFESSEPICNNQMEIIAQTCPKIQFFNLNCKRKMEAFEEFCDDIYDNDDFDDVGVYDIATWCVNLETILLRRRKNVGNEGVVDLVNLSKNLVNLDIGWCKKVTDECLEAIGNANCLRSLNLQGCWMITDVGLGLLTKGCLVRTLEQLVLAECDRITDTGVCCLKKFKCLEELNLADCGPGVTDIGGEAIATMASLKRLIMMWLVNVSYPTILALAQNCKKLVKLDLTGCILVTGDGIRAIGSHKSLEELKLLHIEDFTGDDIEHLVRGCETLKYLLLDKSLWKYIPVDQLERLMQSNCWIEWV